MGKSRLLNWFAGFSFSAKVKKVALLQLKKKVAGMMAFTTNSVHSTTFQNFAACQLEECTLSNCSTVEPRLSGHRLSGLFDYPDFFSSPVFFMNINDLRC